MNVNNRVYYRFYFLKPPASSSGVVDWSKPNIYETRDNWGIVCKSIPYNIMGDAKDLPTNNWVDEDGIEVYLPKEGGIPIKEQSLDVEFVLCGRDARSKMLKFRDFITGRDGSGVHLGFYDSYTGLSANNIVYQSFNPEIYWRRAKTGEIVVFKVNFLLTEPVQLDAVIHPRNGSFDDSFDNSFHKEEIYDFTYSK